MRDIQSAFWWLVTEIFDLLLYGILSRDEYTEHRATVSIAAARRRELQRTRTVTKRPYLSIL